MRGFGAHVRTKHGEGGPRQDNFEMDGIEMDMDMGVWTLPLN